MTDTESDTAADTSADTDTDTAKAESAAAAADAPAGAAAPSRAGLAYALALLAIAAVSSCLLEVAWLFARVPAGAEGQSVAFPVMIALAAVINCAMVAEARKWARSWVVQGFPLAVWLLTLVCLHLGPGGNMPVPPSLRGLLLLAAGLGVPLVLAQVLHLRQITRAAQTSRPATA